MDNHNKLMLLDNFTQLVNELSKLGCSVLYSNKLENEIDFGHYVILGVPEPPHLKYYYLTGQAATPLLALQECIKECKTELNML